MNYKTILLTGAALLISSQAMAAQDITGAFAVPGKGQFTSDTRIGMTRANVKWTAGNESVSAANDGLYAEEQIEYGITDKFSVNAGIANAFDKDAGYSTFWGAAFGEKDKSYNNDHNFAYNVGAKYNTSYEDALFQAAVSYTTWNPHSFYGHHSGTGNDWQKNLGLDLKAGLDLGNGITPYIVYHIDSDIDVAHRELNQSVSVGVHKYTGKWALDGALRYEWTKNHADFWYNDVDGEEYFGNTTETWLDASADYYLKDNVVLGVYGSYLIDSHDRSLKVDGINVPVKNHQSTTYELGLHVKVLF